MSQQPKVSVIIPAYNRAHLVGRAIRSVLAQSFQDFELIVVDDGSTDNTEEVVCAFQDPRIRYLSHDINRGGSAARNTGIRAAQGEYIAFLDSDDEWLPEKLEEQLEVFSSDNRNYPGLVLSGYIVRTRGRDIIKTPRLRGWVLNDLLEYKQSGITSTLMVRRQCVISVNGFDDSFEAFQDRDLQVRLSKHYRFDYVNKPLCVYHQHDGDRVSTTLRQIKACQRILRKYSEELTSRKRILALHHFKIARMYLRMGDVPGARRHIWSSVKAWPWNPKRWFLMASTFAGTRPFLAICKAYSRASRLKQGLSRVRL